MQCTWCTAADINVCEHPFFLFVYQFDAASGPIMCLHPLMTLVGIMIVLINCHIPGCVKTPAAVVILFGIKGLLAAPVRWLDCLLLYLMTLALIFHRILVLKCQRSLKPNYLRPFPHAVVYDSWSHRNHRLEYVLMSIFYLQDWIHVFILISSICPPIFPSSHMGIATILKWCVCPLLY